ncbi:hypothetical protein CYMTET_22611 [Cymbomonas tetramitiformis]|uniref:Uncharacterized protein n=1 Tax=Cymbomonas tetramitiformis TaxID=36881 RepID=A0AAE0G025_9CHLO|nr:hypothetical protein CYMTET_22611 [Cymbomonas tetramitiformis]
MVSQGGDGDENGDDPGPGGSGTTGTSGFRLQSMKGTIEAMLPKVSPAQRDELHTRITLWLTRRSRPLTLPEHNTEFRDVFDVIFRWGYTPPTYQLVVQNILKLSVELAENVHCTVSDIASNIVSGWNCFDGHECTDHTIALLGKVFLEHATITLMFKKLRGMTAHFNHSVIGAKLLKECQASPAVPNPDASVYKSHQLDNEEWNIVTEAMYFPQYTTNACNLLQGTKYATSNLVLPVIGRIMIYSAHVDTPLKFLGEFVKIRNEHVKEARENFYKPATQRYFNKLMDCKLEDFTIATTLDPRYKSSKFKYAHRWMRGVPGSESPDIFRHLGFRIGAGACIFEASTAGHFAKPRDLAKLALENARART